MKKTELTLSGGQLHDPEFSLAREWIEVNPLGNQACTTVAGVNTRKRHGLFIIKTKDQQSSMLLLSQIHEEIYLGKVKYDLFNAEYEKHTSFEGLKNLASFTLDPFPTYYFKFGNVEIEKSIVLLKDYSHLLISYHISGEIESDSRLVIRPFLAFRTVAGTCIREDFENTDVFIMDQQLRYLPFRDAPEIFLQFPGGQFVHSPVWYHNFKYRLEGSGQSSYEDLLNPGFFEYPLSSGKRIFLSASMVEVDIKDIANRFNRESDYRQLFLTPRENQIDKVTYISGKVPNFLKNRGKGYDYLVSDLSDDSLYLSLHCLMALRLLKVSLTRPQAKKYYQDLMQILARDRLHEILMGMDPEVKVEAATPFS